MDTFLFLVANSTVLVVGFAAVLDWRIRCEQRRDRDNVAKLGSDYAVQLRR